VLYQPEAHEQLTDEEWNEERVRGAIRSIVAETEDAFDDGWDTRLRTVYSGGAGIVDALRRLSEGGLVDLRREYVSYLERSLEEPPDFPDENPRGSLFFGEVGIRLALQRLAPSTENLDELSARIEENARDERRELIWGSPGTMHAARELGLDDLWAASAEWLLGERDEDGLWEQNLFGTRVRYLGPAHGFAGCVLALGEDPLAAETARRYAIEQDGLANWPPAAGDELVSPRDGAVRTQWCHGAPGIVTSLGDQLDEDLALAAGELVWRAGPLVKGANLCHGTAGNGYAFLTLFARTGDEQWLTRARSFAMSAIEQVERARSAHGRYAFSLWSGDLGTAVYLADSLQGGGAIPLP
jgi:hypothetical protein